MNSKSPSNCNGCKTCTYWALARGVKAGGNHFMVIESLFI